MKMSNVINLIQGDCLEEMKNIPDNTIDMILTDLPYGQTARNKWDVTIPFNFLWEHYLRIAKQNAAIVLFGNGIFTADLMLSNRDMWRYNLIWEKTQPTGFLNAEKMPLRCHEDICVFYRNLPTYNPQKTCGHDRKVSKAIHKRNCKQSLDYGEMNLTTYDSTERYPRSILTFAKDTQKESLHPTQKPVSLLSYLIKTYTNEQDTVLDSCMGSGSTGIACINTNRNFIGIEKDEKYFNIAKQRMENHSPDNTSNVEDIVKKQRLF